MDDERLYYVFMVIMVLAFAGSAMYTAHTREECIKAYANSPKTGDEIAKICK